MKKIRNILIPTLLGALAFFVCVGPRALDPSNIAWLVHGDFSQHYLGWAFFRNSPWTFPIGLNPGYGLEVSSSIVYSDSIPLLAFFFKIVNSFLPDVFQYNGMWILLCFTLQGLFSWKLLGLMTESDSVKVAGTLFFVFSPPMIWRLQGHESLAGHFLILAAFYLALKKDRSYRLAGWAIVLSAATLVHGYLQLMVLSIWFADVLKRKGKGSFSWRDLAVEVTLLFILTLAVSWQAGYFTLGMSASDEGFGYYSMNLLSPIDPQSFSYVIKNMPINAGQYEGNNYLGLGIVFLAPVALCICFSRKVALWQRIRENYALLSVALALALFALSNKICIGHYCVVIPIGKTLMALANIWRASGRMFWPAFYLIYLVIIYAVIRGANRRFAIILLSVALALQLADLSAGVKNVRRDLMIAPQETWATKLVSPQWKEFAGKYTKIKRYRPKEAPPLWVDISYYAVTHKMGSNAVDLARMNVEGFRCAILKAIRNVDSGIYDKDTLYILEDGLVERAKKGLRGREDTILRIDGINVIVPGYRRESITGSS